jgi:hypothetical protein
MAVTFGLAVLLATGCFSTGGGVKAGLMASVVNTQQDAFLKTMVFTNHRRVPDLTI